MFRKATLLICGVLLLSSCSSSDDSEETADDGVKLSGVVAAGAPLAGFIALKDADGNTVTAAIDADGNYSVNVKSLTPPFVLYASGLSGNKAYSIASAATVDDLEGTVNITPLTDLVIANVAGQNSEDFFNSPDFNLITTASLDAEAEKIKLRIQPMLDALSVSADFDIMNTPFVADHSGFDAVLDTIEVTVDKTNNSATITNVLDTTQTITDNFSQTDTSVLTVDSTTVTTALTERDAIRAKLTELSTLFRNSVPDAAQVAPYFHDSFLSDGANKTDFVNKLIQEAANAKARIEIADFILYAGPIKVDTTTIPLTATLDDWDVEKDATNGWQLKGNQQLWRAEVRTKTLKDQFNGTVYNNIFFEFEDESSGQTNIVTDDYIIITGPGIAEMGYTSGYAVPQSDTGFGGESLSLNDTAVGQTNDGDVYTFTRYHDTNADSTITNGTVSVTTTDSVVDSYTYRLKKRPFLSTDSVTYPTITSPTPGGLDNFSSGSLKVTWKLPDGLIANDVAYIRLVNGATDEERFEAEATSPTQTSITIPNITSPSGALDYENIIVFTTDSFGRDVAVILNAQPGSSTASIYGSWGTNEAPDGMAQMILFPDNTFIYAENDLSYPAPRDAGLEAGTFTYNAASDTIDFTLNYDDNGPGNNSGVGDTGSSISISAIASATKLSMFNGAFVLPANDFSASPIQGVWKNGAIDSTDFAVMVFYADGRFIYAEKDSTITDPSENGLEGGTYVYNSTTNEVTFTLNYDDNGPGIDSGVGDIVTPKTTTAVLSNNNNTLTLAGGALVFNREF